MHRQFVDHSYELAVRLSEARHGLETHAAVSSGAVAAFGAQVGVSVPVEPGGRTGRGGNLS